uniref:Uncharacterized protein MANES_13G050000 n=1 Tax=Rhizophora mucronata TaxID=61149 RepID=A0A2P2LUM7_RHIMU
MQVTIGDGFPLEVGLDIEVRVQEGVQILEVEKPTAGVISVPGQSLETGEVVGMDFQIMEVMDIGGIKQGTTAAAQTAPMS